MNENAIDTRSASRDADEPESTEGRPRRALFTGAAALGLGAAASVLFRARTAAAANGDKLILGQGNAASSNTTLTSTAANGLLVYATAGNAIYAETSAGATSSAGLYAYDASSGGNYGVIATSGTGTGVLGQTAADNNFGIQGSDSSTGGGTGVGGTSTNGIGVSGISNAATGRGVEGISDSGVGVYAASVGGTALMVLGPTNFSRSGIATIPAGSQSFRVSVADVTESNAVLATLQSFEKGVALAAAVAGSGTITFHLHTAPTTSMNVAWFVLN